jgi:hypothetical protein
MDCLDNRNPALLRGFLVLNNVWCLVFGVWCLVFGVQIGKKSNPESSNSFLVFIIFS